MKKTVFTHLAVWMVWCTGFWLHATSLSGEQLHLLDMVIYYATIASVIYAISLGCFCQFYSKGKRVKFIASLLLVAVLFYLFRYFHIVFLNPILAPGQNELDPFTWRKFWTRQSWLFFQYCIFGIGYFFHLDAMSKQKENQAKELDIKNAQLRENEARQAAVEAEVNYLRAQFNNHFLFNVLYCFYDKATLTDPPLAEGIYQLSDLMRYSLQQNPGQMVPLSKEIEQTQNFIALCQVCYNNSLHIDWQVEGATESKYILPMVIVSLVENALKHGQLRNPTEPLRIQVQINSQIALKIENKKARQMAQHTNGTGNKNLQRRLELAYGAKHQVAIKEDASYYRYELILEN